MQIMIYNKLLDIEKYIKSALGEEVETPDLKTFFDSEMAIRVHALFRISNANKIIENRLNAPHVTAELRELLESIQKALYDFHPTEK